MFQRTIIFGTEERENPNHFGKRNLIIQEKARGEGEVKNYRSNRNKFNLHIRVFIEFQVVIKVPCTLTLLR